MLYVQMIVVYYDNKVKQAVHGDQSQGPCTKFLTFKQNLLSYLSHHCKKILIIDFSDGVKKYKEKY